MGDNISVIKCTTRQDINDFLNFPKTLYENEYNPQDYKAEKQLLTGKHPLSKDFEIIPLLLYKVTCDENRVLARCIITTYKDDDIAYIGLFESVDIPYVYLTILDEAKKISSDLGKTQMVGPVDASFWIRYRFKYTSDRRFRDTYTGEPYNKERYTQMWLDAGFEIDNVYSSNFYREVNESDSSEKCKLRIRQMTEKGYIIKSSSIKEFDKDIVEIHRMITELYSKFPVYKNITLKQFKSLFGYLKYVLNYSMVKMVYKDGKAVAFFICVPNYTDVYIEKNLFGVISKLLKIRKNPKEYVMLYMGVEPKHLGLGGALAEVTKQELVKNGCTSIGALIQEGKPTNIYYKDLIVGKTTYVTLKQDIE